MTGSRRNIFTGIFFILFCSTAIGQSAFVQTQEHQFTLNGMPYYYVGTNYWYGGLLGLQANNTRGAERLRKELDFLKSKGVQNLRVLGGTEGAGMIQGVQRVQPSLQSAKGVFNENNLNGLDLLLSEMGKRNMKAVIYLSNNWEWSGGFLQYLNWNGKLPDSLLQRKLNWDSLRDVVSTFYTCKSCVKDYLKQVQEIIGRTNTVTGKKYKDDEAIMSWELANEPRPMRLTAREAYLKWIDKAATYIHSKDKNHLVTTGSEGWMGLENPTLFQEAHAIPKIDYLTIHIWPKNWGWFKPETMQADLPNVLSKTNEYIRQHDSIALLLNKPLVVEEFGFPRDGHSFSMAAATHLRDEYYKDVFGFWQKSAQQGGAIGGINFWAFGGTARPIADQAFWKNGDDYMGDPPMEEQGLNTVFDSDASTWNVITAAQINTSVTNKNDDAPADKQATKETVALYKHLKKMAAAGKTLFGHQDDLAYGVGWKYEPGRSDTKEATGDYPAIYGWELGNLENDLAENLDSVPFDKMKGFIKEAYGRGSIVTISWHFDNPVNGESAWDTTHGGVAAILPGGAKHEMYKSWLDKFSVFMNDLKGQNGEAIPTLFRPFHEHTGNWFWWCQNTCTPAEFKDLWRFTINYLQNERGLHNLLYVFNTADFTNSEQYLQRYPGDDLVDVVSFDAYQYGNAATDSSFVQKVNRQLTTINAIATQHNKIPALAETGYEAIPYADWWTKRLLPAMAGQQVSYVLLWRNYGRQANGNMHYYVPFKGQNSEKDFKRFYETDRMLFGKKIAKEKVYQ